MLLRPALATRVPKRLSREFPPTSLLHISLFFQCMFQYGVSSSRVSSHRGCRIKSPIIARRSWTSDITQIIFRFRSRIQQFDRVHHGKHPFHAGNLPLAGIVDGKATLRLPRPNPIRMQLVTPKSLVGRGFITKNSERNAIVISGPNVSSRRPCQSPLPR
jgi:hypothetical protein